MNHEIPGVQTGFRKGRGTRGQIANICWIIKKAREFQKKKKKKKKKTISALLTMPKPLTNMESRLLGEISITSDMQMASH